MQVLNYALGAFEGISFKRVAGLAIQLCEICNRCYYVRALDKLMVMRKEAITRDTLGLPSLKKSIAKKRKEDNGQEEASDKAL